MLILIKAANSKFPRCATYLSNKVSAVASRSPSYQAHQDSAAIDIVANCVLAILVHFVVLCFFFLFFLVFPRLLVLLFLTSFTSSVTIESAMVSKSSKMNTNLTMKHSVSRMNQCLVLFFNSVCSMTEFLLSDTEKF